MALRKARRSGGALLQAAGDASRAQGGQEPDARRATAATTTTAAVASGAAARAATGGGGGEDRRGDRAVGEDLSDEAVAGIRDENAARRDGDSFRLVEQGVRASALAVAGDAREAGDRDDVGVGTDEANAVVACVGDVEATGEVK